VFEILHALLSQFLMATKVSLGRMEDSAIAMASL
jgi:hypothetical protein